MLNSASYPFFALLPGQTPKSGSFPPHMRCTSPTFPQCSFPQFVYSHSRTSPSGFPTAGPNVPQDTRLPFVKLPRAPPAGDPPAAGRPARLGGRGRLPTVDTGVDLLEIRGRAALSSPRQAGPRAAGCEARAELSPPWGATGREPAAEGRGVALLLLPPGKRNATRIPDLAQQVFWAPARFGKLGEGGDEGANIW